MNLSEFLLRYSDEKLSKAFKEIEKYRKDNILPLESMTRKIYKEYTTQEQLSDSWDIGCRYTSNEIIFELARRYYKGKENN